MANTKRPSSSVTAVRTLPCVLLVSVTVTPGSTPPCGSWTAPVTEALVVCARSTAGLPAQTRASKGQPPALPAASEPSSQEDIDHLLLTHRTEGDAK